MFHQRSPSHEFFCLRCQGVMRIYARIGFSLLGLLMAALTAAVLWLRFFR